MARREGELDLLLDELARAPWWVSVVVAVVVYIGLAKVLPSLAGGAVVDAISGLAVWVAAIFLLPAAVSAFRVWRGRRMLAANRTKEAIRSLGWEEFEELIEAHYRRLGFRARREAGAGPGRRRGRSNRQVGRRDIPGAVQAVADAAGWGQGRQGVVRSRCRRERDGGHCRHGWDVHA